MESLYLLIPLSVVLVLAIGGVLVWSVMAGQFDDLDGESDRILRDEEAASGSTTGPDNPAHAAPEKSRRGK